MIIRITAFVSAAVVNGVGHAVNRVLPVGESHGLAGVVNPVEGDIQARRKLIVRHNHEIVRAVERRAVFLPEIDFRKGAGTVVNGYESISGQINTELIKPANDVPLFVNLFGSTDARFEANVHLNKKVSDKWATSLFLHGNARTKENDMNKDGFLDNPLSNQGRKGTKHFQEYLFCLAHFSL